MPDVSIRRSCRLLQVCRATVQRRPRQQAMRRRQPAWIMELQTLIQAHPTFGYRRYGRCCDFNVA
jgi:hypothetical protein